MEIGEEIMVAEEALEEGSVESDLPKKERTRKKEGGEGGFKDAEVMKLEKKMAKMQAEYAAKISEMERKAYESEFMHALERGITKLKGKNWRAICPLIDLGELSLGEAGEVEGLSTQIERLKESDGYLFHDGEKPKMTTGNIGNFPRKAVSGKANPWSKEGYNLTEQGRMLREEPEKAKKMMMQAGGL